MKRPRRLSIHLAAMTLLGGFALHSVSTAHAAQVITCHYALTMRFSPALTLTPQDNVVTTVGNPDGVLSQCTGDPGMNGGQFVSTGIGNGVTCGVGSYQDKSGGIDNVNWQVTSGESTSGFTWKMEPVSDLLNVQNPLSGGLSTGRYKNATWTVTVDPLQSKVNLADCNTLTGATGLTSMDLAGTAVFTVADSG
ncbi:hypothetical protein LKL35_36815 [Streptomyces sp. ET3-23]|uniref:hypothetical protein n=1 Tax=Streptomyces sp. ET3-23 TaxID=2885643 RepID=UPI001D11E56D|nr:hypothetical protein [Streptomyces sp. ET3-23]MCC2280888.1 hypothetical protein [Streptomyces sp. ET3-23]